METIPKQDEKVAAHDIVATFQVEERIHFPIKIPLAGASTLIMFNPIPHSYYINQQ